jgi:hypothetical protein
MTALVTIALAVASAHGGGGGTTAKVRGALDATVAVTALGRPAVLAVVFGSYSRGIVEIRPVGRAVLDGGYSKTFIPSFSSTVTIPGTSL